jgi:hypothetical protein
MTVILLSFAVFAIALFGMSVGVVFSNRRIRGSCGGLSAIRDKHGDMRCAACSSNPDPDCSVPTEGVCRHGRVPERDEERLLEHQARV